ncbi:unnamed protein product [Larinioides sclopetarius]|uniref:Uncharacterized protein n=1 Tax=Larinioides sclopetarius TaxID=280406 RepID=A0AAV2BTC9_9ARAC
MILTVANAASSSTAVVKAMAIVT